VAENGNDVTEYTEAFRSKVVQRMLGPEARSATSLSRQTGISQPTLSRWLRDAQGRVGGMSKTASPDPPPPPPRPRRPEDWKPEERLRVVFEASQLGEGELGAFLRREGLHEATLEQWREAALEALRSPAAKAGATAASSRKVRHLEKELRRKDKALAEAAALLVLQKKAQELWGDEDDDTDPRSDK
jgi:transposase